MNGTYMLRLYIMRHAKSSWAIPGARDFDRELNEKGLEDLKKISKHIKKHNISPDLVLCSSATRTRQTLDSVVDAFEKTPEISYTEKLYSSGLSEYIEIINSVNNANSIMIIGHNPMCGSLATSLPGSGEAEQIEKIAYRYPTAALTTIDFETENWSTITKGNGILQNSLFPSEI